MGSHLALTCLSHAIAFFGVRQDDGGLALVRRCSRISRMNFDQIMATAFQTVNLLIAQALSELGKLGVLAKEVIAVKTPIFRGEGLHLSVHRVGKGANQRLLGVSCKQAVPVTAPNEFDHIPARTAKEFFQFVNDAAITANWPIQALQIAIDHPYQVVQFFAGGKRQCAHALGLIHFTVAKHAPDFALTAVQQLAVREVAHEPGVVDGADGAQPHRACGELPKIGHQPRVRVA